MVNQKIELIKAYDRFELNLTDSIIDRMLGISKENDDDINTKSEYMSEQIFYEGTPYSYIRAILSVLDLGEEDLIYDLGSGYGRFVIYGALTRKLHFYGIELLKKRVEKAKNSAEELHLNNAFFENNNILTADYSSGSVFFLFNPFCYSTLNMVGSNLRQIAEGHPIKIITWGGASNDYFKKQEWLDEKQSNIKLLNKIQFFESS